MRRVTCYVVLCLVRRLVCIHGRYRNDSLTSYIILRDIFRCLCQKPFFLFGRITFHKWLKSWIGSLWRLDGSHTGHIFKITIVVAREAVNELNRFSDTRICDRSIVVCTVVWPYQRRSNTT